MAQLTLNMPNGVSLDERDTRRFLAAKLYEDGKLTLAQGAELAQLSAVAFAEILADYGVAFINYPASDITSDAARI